MLKTTVLLNISEETEMFFPFLFMYFLVFIDE